MSFEEFKSFFKDELVKNHIDSNIDYESFYKYMKEILEWNEKINLTAIKDEKEFVIKHFVDSLTISSLIPDNINIIDVGTGAGFPGIPLKIVKKELNIGLLDSVNKKLMVIDDISKKLGLNNIETIHGRVEDIAHFEGYREAYDIATSRAVSNLTTLSEYLLPLVKVGGKVICMKGPNYEEEITLAKNAIKLLGGKIIEVTNLKIDDELERNIIIIKKIAKTPKKYPRISGLPLKKPLN